MNKTELDIFNSLYEKYGKYYIETDRENRSYFDWIFSRGTNFTCFYEYKSSLSEENELDNTIEVIRTIIYALHRPFMFTFFYWTILIFVLYKFNFKNRIIRLILYHFILRIVGDVLDKFGDLMPHYFSNEIIENDKEIIYKCNYDVKTPEMHPLRWVLTRQIGIFFWYAGEICLDWYPLIRTREIVKDAKSIWYIYVTCGLFNLSKIILSLYHLRLSPKMLYDKDGQYRLVDVEKFYFPYWGIQLVIIIFSILYDVSVYHVLKKYSFHIENSGIGFVKKFKTFSIYRIRISAITAAVFLPLIIITILVKYYYGIFQHYYNLEFSFDEIRTSIANLQYFIVFIDQILLSYSEISSSRTKNSSVTYKENKSFNENSPEFKYKFDSLGNRSHRSASSLKRSKKHLDLNNLDGGGLMEYNKYDNNPSNDMMINNNNNNNNYNYNQNFNTTTMISKNNDYNYLNEPYVISYPRYNYN